MLLPPPRHAIAISTCLLGMLISFDAISAQDAELQRKIAAIRNARQRAQTEQSMAPTGETAAPAVRTASAQIEMVADQPAPTMAMRSGMAPRRRFLPRHQRTAQLSDGMIIDDGSPIMGDQSMYGDAMGSGIVMGDPIVDGQVMAEPFVDGGCGDPGCGGCNSCGEIGGYFDESCCDRGGCPPGTPCWLDGFGKILRNAEFYSGFTSFRSALFTSPSTAQRTYFDDCSHGYYGGVNVGIPLCRLTCGIFSGQFGVRTVNTNFNGNAFSEDGRDQLFFTAGFYRRVDYGLQFGVVADVLREEWFANSDLVQIRGDIGYVWPIGTTFGFRFANNVQDDVVDGSLNGIPFSDMVVTTNENYRFYLRHDAKRGGFGEIFAGWSKYDQGIIGMDFDMPLTNRIALEAGFTYYLNDDGVPANAGLLGGNADQAYNTYVGFSFRPRGRAWYKNYDRPLFDVADNGSMLTVR